MTLSPTPTTPRTLDRQAGGFSLVEVLMAVLILSLGLLGLGAIMPAVVKQQRVGADQTFGTLAARSVGAAIRGNARLNTANPSSGNVNLRNYPRWEAWARSLPSAGYTNYGIPEDGSWLTLRVDASPNGGGTARAVIGPIAPPTTITAVDDAFINLQDRLVPSLASVSSKSGVTSEPQFVVDLAVRRMTPFVAGQLGASGVVLYERPGNFTVQLALISRRVDQRIRPGLNAGQPVSIMQSITSIPGVTSPALPLANHRWPISEDSNGNPLGGGETTGTGDPRYSLPYTVNVTFDPAVPDRLVVVDALPSSLATSPTARNAQTAFQQMSGSGQIIVDNLGTIYNVQGADDRVSNPLAVRISPPVASGVAASASTDPRRLHQVLVCPQAPASINIITVNP